MNDRQISKTLAKILRHSALDDGLPMRPDGFLSLESLSGHPSLKKCHLSLELIQNLVTNDSKQRYHLIQESNGKWFIRANQGHSMPDVMPSLYRFQEPSEITHPVIHGTFTKVYKECINIQGLSKMKRNLIHFAPGLPDENQVISGMRRSAEIYIYLDVNKAMQDGMVLYRSQNNVILTEGFQGVIPPTYFLRVTDKWGRAL